MEEKCIIGIDPGSKSGIVVVSIEAELELLYHTTWNKHSKNRRNRPTDVIMEIRSRYNVLYAVIEDQYMGMNVKTLKVLSKIAGAWEEACLSQKIPIKWIEPTGWQTAILGPRNKRKSDELCKAYTSLACLETGKELTPDESAAWCITKYDRQTVTG